MNLVKSYGKIVKNYVEKGKTETALKLITFGLNYSIKQIQYFPKKDMPEALRYLNKLSLRFMSDSLMHPENYCWTNIFAPTEFIHAFGLKPLCIESFSSFMSGFYSEDLFIDKAEASGISENLCSYHRAFIGAAESRLLPKPKFAVTSSMLCDGNINTFRYLSNLYKIPYYIIDVPYEYSKDSENYVANQLKEMVKMIEDATHKKLDIDRLKEVIETENETYKYIHTYAQKLSTRYYPNTLTLEMYKLFATHVFMGTNDAKEFYKLICEDIDKYKEGTGKRIFWVHLLPFYHNVLKESFNYNTDYQLIGMDLNFDYPDEELNPNDPYNSIARKLLLNCFNGSFDRKIERILKTIKELNADAVINFCQFGCKQSSGGALMLKKALNDAGYPFLSIDGDAVDRRSSHEGQIKTRLDAFFEILNNDKQFHDKENQL